jgi:hypothetical protein
MHGQETRGGREGNAQGHKAGHLVKLLLIN